MRALAQKKKKGHERSAKAVFWLRVHRLRTCVCVRTRRTVVCPIIDVISDDTFEYMAGSDMTYGGFNWKLNFRWYPVPQREMDRRKGDRTLPVRWVIPPRRFSSTRRILCAVSVITFFVPFHLALRIAYEMITKGRKETKSEPFFFFISFVKS